jgi:hypothetical protein
MIAGAAVGATSDIYHSNLNPFVDIECIQDSTG